MIERKGCQTKYSNIWRFSYRVKTERKTILKVLIRKLTVITVISHIFFSLKTCSNVAYSPRYAPLTIRTVDDGSGITV
ncbi:unnamed protein product [Schistosoma curassoni]|uniref:Uncharacterized protein n=1 Tax=Schistosoma curassoni TaxID=6186 RepID=A0A183KT18_9TREM|nr:unnamed protein product [Schistosoma curassoni]